MDERERSKPAARKVFQQQLVLNAVSEATDEKEAQAFSNRKDIRLPDQKTSEELQQEKGGLKIRETGWWFWRTIVLPPNAYVVHTRRGCKAPITLGLGISFRYNPNTDSYITVPAALQTIGIIAQGISKEKQGISILAYVQWMISDFAIAYRHLDFSDNKDPMGIVNAQLREQAEAAIKDKISTMSVQEILTDKAPIIKELTQRMKAVAEGKGEGGVGGGLGLHIVTVQIKEAFVSSQKLWEFLQAPFRNEREREARLSRLRVEEEIRQQELANRKSIENAESQTQSDISKIKASKERESFEIVLKERIRRQELENEEKQRVLALEQELQMKKRESQRSLQEYELLTEQELNIIKAKQAQSLALQKITLDSEQTLKAKEIEVEASVKQLEAETKLRTSESEEQQKLDILRAKQEQELALEKARLNADQLLTAKEIEITANMKKIEAETKLKAYEFSLQLQQLEGQKTFLQKEDEVSKIGLQYKVQKELAEADHKLALQQKTFQQTKAQEEESYRIANAQKQKELEFLQAKQAIENSVSPENLSSRMISVLPELAKQMPKIQELRTLNISTDGQHSDGFSLLGTYLAKLLEIGRTLGIKLPKTEVEQSSKS